MPIRLTAGRSWPRGGAPPSIREHRLVAEKGDPDAGLVVPAADLVERALRQLLRLVEDQQAAGVAQAIADPARQLLHRAARVALAERGEHLDLHAVDPRAGRRIVASQTFDIASR
jgi:hypothetical protein